ncbi:hypothetical protein Ae201684P_019266 [Aphanomyces euteiches]|nr:hypothetical protein Ae201684P_019266 [Aphanomyces euteiches]
MEASRSSAECTVVAPMEIQRTLARGSAICPVGHNPLSSWFVALDLRATWRDVLGGILPLIHIPSVEIFNPVHCAWSVTLHPGGHSSTYFHPSIAMRGV